MDHQPSELVEGKYAPYNGITPYEEGNPMSYTFLGVEISPTLFAIGWFMKFRAALLVNLGAILAWFWLIPLAVLQDVPVYDPEQGVYRDITEMGPIVQWQAFGSIIRTVAIGASSEGIPGLFKMAPTFIGIFGTSHRPSRGAGRGIRGRKGLVRMAAVPHPHFHGYLACGNHCHLRHRGYPVLPSLIFSVVLLSTTFLWVP